MVTVSRPPGRMPAAGALVRGAALGCIVIGLGTLIGWLSGLPLLVHVRPGFAPTPFDTGVALLLLGGGSWLRARARRAVVPRSTALLRAARVLHLGVLIVVATHAFRRLTDAAITPGELLLPLLGPTARTTAATAAADGGGGGIAPARILMSLDTLACLAMVALAELLGAGRRAEALRRSAGFVTLALASLAFGRLFTGGAMPGPLRFTGMSFASAVAFVLMGAALLGPPVRQLVAGQVDVRHLRRMLTAYAVVGTAAIALNGIALAVVPMYHEIARTELRRLRATVADKSEAVERELQRALHVASRVAGLHAAAIAAGGDGRAQLAQALQLVDQVAGIVWTDAEGALAGAAGVGDRLVLAAMIAHDPGTRSAASVRSLGAPASSAPPSPSSSPSSPAWSSPSSPSSSPSSPPWSSPSSPSSPSSSPSSTPDGDLEARREDADEVAADASAALGRATALAGSPPARLETPVFADGVCYLAVRAPLFAPDGAWLGEDLLLLQTHELGNVLRGGGPDTSLMLARVQADDPWVITCAGNHWVRLPAELTGAFVDALQARLASSSDGAAELGARAGPAADARGGALEIGAGSPGARLIAFGPLRTNDWWLLVDTPSAAVYGNADRELQSTIVVLLLLAGLGAFAVHMLVRPLTRCVVLNAEQLEERMHASTVALEQEVRQRELLQRQLDAERELRRSDERRRTNDLRHFGWLLARNEVGSSLHRETGEELGAAWSTDDASEVRRALREVTAEIERLFAGRGRERREGSGDGDAASVDEGDTSAGAGVDEGGDGVDTGNVGVDQGGDGVDTGNVGVDEGGDGVDTGNVGADEWGDGVGTGNTGVDEEGDGETRRRLWQLLARSQQLEHLLRSVNCEAREGERTRQRREGTDAPEPDARGPSSQDAAADEAEE